MRCLQAARGATLSGSRGLARVSLLVAGIVLILDQLTKYLAVTHLEGQPPVQLVGDLLRLNFTRNPGAAFSLGGEGYTAIISIIAIGICVVIVRSARKLGSVWWAVFLGGMLGGAIGNLIDRFLRAPGFLRGHVVDFLQLPHWPIFNVADMAIVGSAIGLVILSMLGIDMDGTRHRGKESDAADSQPAESEPAESEPADSEPAESEPAGDTQPDEGGR